MIYNNENRGERITTQSIPVLYKGIGAAVISLFLLITFVAGCKTVNPGNVGIEVSKAGSSRGVKDVTIKTGWVFYNPFITEVIEYPVFMQTAKWTKSATEGSADDESITFTTSDSSTVNADISVSYQLQYEKVPEFYVKFRADNIQEFTDGFMRNVIRDSFNDAAGKYTVEQVMGDNAKLISDAKAIAQSKLTPYGVEVEQLGLIGAPRPPDSVNQAINMKVQAQQIALQKQIEVTQAEADAKKQEAAAEGQAQSNVIIAQSEATSNKLRNDSLTPLLVEQNKVDKWDGHNPDVISGQGSGSLIVSVK